MKTKYTQGKAYLQEYTDSYTNIVRCNNGKGFETSYIASATERDNAKRIVKCWNMHDELIEMLIEVDKSHSIPPKDWDEKTYKTCQKVKELIKKATE